MIHSAFFAKAEIFNICILIHSCLVCPGSGILTKEAGTIKSPNFPEHYFGGIKCDWTIVVPDGKRIRVKSKSLNLESCISCGSCDHIEISDDSLENPIIGKWCKTHFDVISRGSTINIKFISNVNEVGENFVIEYEAVNDDKGRFNRTCFLIEISFNIFSNNDIYTAKYCSKLMKTVLNNILLPTLF